MMRLDLALAVATCIVACAGSQQLDRVRDASLFRAALCDSLQLHPIDGKALLAREACARGDEYQQVLAALGGCQQENP